MGNVRTTTGQDLPETGLERKGRARRTMLIVVAVLTAVGLAGHFISVNEYAYATGYATTADYAEVRSPVGGRVLEIVRSSGDEVAKGDVLMKLDDSVERADYEEARSQVAKGEAELALREAEAADALVSHRNAVKAAEMELGQARKNLELTRQLFDKSLASGRQLSGDEFAVSRIEESLRALNEMDMELLQKQVEVLRKNVDALREAETRAKVALDLRSVRAPIPGRIVRYTFYAGEIIRPDMVLYEVFDGPVDTMKLRVPERYATKVASGQLVQAKLGTHRGIIPRRFPGKVAELRPVVENDGKDVYRTAYCGLDSGSEQVPPGTTVDVRILIGRTSIWGHVFKP